MMIKTTTKASVFIVFFSILTGCVSLQDAQETQASKDQIINANEVSHELDIERPSDKMDKDLTSAENIFAIDIGRQVNIDNLELKQAKTWSRLDALEVLVSKLQQKIQVLEKGLLLGIPPKKNKHKPSNKYAYKLNSHLVPTKKKISKNNLDSKEASPNKPNKLNENDHKTMTKIYKKRLIMAQNYFSEGKFAKAYLEFSALERDFDPKITSGEPIFWIGRCWLKLKEFQNAKLTLQRFIKSHPSNLWIPSARYYLAKVELGLGLRENAVKQLQFIIKNFPYEGTSEAAKQLLANLRRNL